MQNFTLVLGCKVLVLFFIRFLILSLIDVLSGLLATDWLGDWVSSALAPSIETVLTGDPMSMKNWMLLILFVAFKSINPHGYKSLILLRDKEAIPTNQILTSLVTTFLKCHWSGQSSWSFKWVFNVTKT